ncbi:ADP-ribosylglycohydrolase family protein [Agaribacterium haliotis]|uniref:ADP-ribosylglycohydrolase family protein n=1 Tax=Agaribacterium haliotis TaxID=2013869 RepID=UPI000BB54D50|nr:ADP-ribosylglycohydrolase family protein [Agaribacterium haliotis]
MKIVVPPISTRLHQGFYSKTQWLANYHSFREKLAAGIDHSIEIKSFLDSIGKNSSDLALKYRGCLLGLAIGDALGTTLEFSDRIENESHREIIGGGPFNLNPGEWTDDTSMALCLAHSLYSNCSFSLKDQMDFYVAWWKDGFLSSNGRCFDIGNTVLGALQRYLSNGNPVAGSRDEHSAGNGSLMRLAPVPLFFASDPVDAIEKSGVSSTTTHTNEQAVDACRYYAALILGALDNVSKEDLLSPEYCPEKKYWDYFPLCPQVAKVAKGSYKQKDRSEIRSSGYVIDSLEAALWAFYSTSNFEEGLVKVVNLGGDSDTVGAIYGQLAGAFYGEDKIPFKYIAPLKNSHYFYFLRMSLFNTTPVENCCF